MSETAINSTNATYNIPNYNVEINYIYKWMGMLIPYSYGFLKRHLILSVILFVGVCTDLPSYL